MVERKWDLDREETDDGCCKVIILHVFLERKWVNYVFKKKVRHKNRNGSAAVDPGELAKLNHKSP